MAPARTTSVAALALRPLRMIWRRLTSMRTALILLFLLAVAAVPGSLLPQRPLNPDKTASYIQSHGALGPAASTGWASSTCSALGVVRRDLPAAVRLARRLPDPAHPGARPRRWSASRCPPRATSTGCPSPGASRRPISRRAYARRGARGAGPPLADRPTRGGRRRGHPVGGEGLQPRDRQPALPRRAAGGAGADRGRPVVQLPRHPDRRAGPTGFLQHDLAVRRLVAGPAGGRGQGPPGRLLHRSSGSVHAPPTTRSGEPSQFAAHITYRDTANGPIKHTTITVNHPLRLEGDRVYLISHGFAPQFTVRMPDGYDASPTPRRSCPRRRDHAVCPKARSRSHGRAGQEPGRRPLGFFAPTPRSTSATASSRRPRRRSTTRCSAVFVYVGDLNYNGAAAVGLRARHARRLRKIGAVEPARVGQTGKLHRTASR